MILHYSKRSLFWRLIIFGYLSFTTVRRQKIGFISCECIKFLNIANIHALDVWGKRIFIWNNKIFSFAFFPFILFARQLFSTPVTSSTLRNQAPLFTDRLSLFRLYGFCKSILLKYSRIVVLEHSSEISFNFFQNLGWHAMPKGKQSYISERKCDAS